VNGLRIKERRCNLKLKQDIRLTENFSVNEYLTDNDSEELSVEHFINIQNLTYKLQLLRNIVGRIDITPNGGGYRGGDYNKRIGGTQNPPSHHTKGFAADIKFDFRGWTRSSMTKLLQALGFTNVNFYWNAQRSGWVWLHVDIGDTWNKQQFNYRDMDAITKKEIKV